MCLRVVWYKTTVVGHAVLVTILKRSQRAASWFVQSVTVGVSTIILRPDTADELDCPRVSVHVVLSALPLAVSAFGAATFRSSFYGSDQLF
jgi:hypothetical protein